MKDVYALVADEKSRVIGRREEGGGEDRDGRVHWHGLKKLASHGARVERNNVYFTSVRAYLGRSRDRFQS